MEKNAHTTTMYVEVPAAFSISGSWHFHIDPLTHGQGARKTTTTSEHPPGKGKERVACAACKDTARIPRQSKDMSVFCVHIILVLEQHAVSADN